MRCALSRMAAGSIAHSGRSNIAALHPSASQLHQRTPLSFRMPLRFTEALELLLKDLHKALGREIVPWYCAYWCWFRGRET
jgi:hypothetical protein